MCTQKPKGRYVIIELSYIKKHFQKGTLKYICGELGFVQYFMEISDNLNVFYKVKTNVKIRM